MPRRRQNPEHDVTGVELFVRTFDAATGASALVPIAPSILPGSEWRHRRPLPPRKTTWGCQ